MKASEITIAEGDEESSSDEDDDDDDDDDDEDDDDGTVNDRDETESVTVVGEDEEKEVDVLETIEEEKVGAVRLNLFSYAPYGCAIRNLSARKRLHSWASRRTRHGPLRTWSAHHFPGRLSRCSMLDLVCFPVLLAATSPLITCALGEYWAQKAYGTTSSDSRGKQLRRDGFSLAEERYGLCPSRK